MGRTIARSTCWGIVLTCTLLGSLPVQGQGLRLATKEQLDKLPPALVPYRGAALPARVDLTADMPPVGNQGPQGSCVGWTIAYAMKSFHEKLEERVPFTDGRGAVNLQRVFSPAFLYNQNNGGHDGGMYFSHALNFLQKNGVSTWADMPYKVDDYRSKPSRTAVRNAKRYRILDWKAIHPVNTPAVKAQLAAGFPVMIGVTPDDGFNQARNGFRWDRQVGERSSFGHAVLLVGYDDSKQAFRLMNSYGTKWGDNGLIWLDYLHFERVVNEAYIAMDASNGGRPAPTPIMATPDRVVPTTTVTDWRPKKVSFSITSVQHNTTFPNRPDLGQFMRFDGQLYIPPGMGRSDQVVIHFFGDNGSGGKGQAVTSVQPQYRDVYGNAAAGTAVYPVPAEGLNTTWAAWIPYNALYLYSGQYVQTPQGTQYQPYRSALVAEPTLFIDNFGVAKGRPIQFYVDR